MITVISLENFKGVRERAELELRPITLLFGANSAGKSTILHALHYLSEVLWWNNLDPDRTSLGGEQIDLGGFRNLLHQHDTGQSMTIGIEVSVNVEDWPDFDFPDVYDDIDLPRLEPLLIRPEKLAIELTIAWSDLLDRPFIANQQIFFDGTRIASISSAPGRKNTTAELDLTHDCLTDLEDCSGLEAHFYKIPSDIETNAFAEILQMSPSSPQFRTDKEYEQWLRNWPMQCRSSDALLDEHTDFRHDGYEVSGNDPLAQEVMDNALESTFKQILVAPRLVISQALRSQLYIGPVREAPPRNFAPQNQPGPGRWASGIAAWDVLSQCDQNLVDAVSNWMEDSSRLDTGYSVQRKRFVELDLANPIYARLVSGTGIEDLEFSDFPPISDLPIKSRLSICPIDSSIELQTSDVGTGISQVLPVVVAALAGSQQLVAIEQPELHIHPRVQAELGDLLIATIQEPRSHRFIIETHSEHLVLRLLRRIRETSDGDLPEGHPGLRPEDVSVIYLERMEGETQAHNLRIDETGEFIDQWPKGFFEERAKELF